MSLFFRKRNLHLALIMIRYKLRRISASLWQNRKGDRSVL